MFDSSKYFATTSALTWCIGVKLVFHTTSLLPQLPKNYSVFRDISVRLFLKIHEDGFSVFSSPSACFSPIPHEVPHEGLSPLGTFFSVWSFFPLDACWFIGGGAYDYGPWDLPSHCGEHFNGANTTLLYIEDLQQALRIMVGGCGQQECMCGSCHRRSFQGTRHQVRHCLPLLHPPWA